MSGDRPACAERTRSGLASQGITPLVLSGATVGHDRVRDGTEWVHRALGHGPARRTTPITTHLFAVPLGTVSRCLARSPAGTGLDDVRTTVIRPRPLARVGSGLLPAVHPPPINPVVFRGSYLFSEWGDSSWAGIPA